MGSPSPFGTIPCVFHHEPQVLHVVLDDVGPSLSPLSLSSSTPLEQSAGVSTGIAVTASFSQQTEDRAFC